MKKPTKPKEHFRAMPMQYKDGEYHIPWFIVGARSNIELAKGVHVIPLAFLVDRFVEIRDLFPAPASALTHILYSNKQVLYVRVLEKNYAIPNQILRSVWEHAREIFLTLGLIEPEQEVPF